MIGGPAKSVNVAQLTEMCVTEIHNDNYQVIGEDLNNYSHQK